MNEKFTLQELIDALAARHQMELHDADAFVKAFWTLIEEGLTSDNYVKIKGLGTFKLIETEARESINIQTGERIEIQSHARVTFTPDVSLRDQINRPFAHFETVVLNESTQFDEWDEKEGTISDDVSVDNSTKDIQNKQFTARNLDQTMTPNEQGDEKTDNLVPVISENEHYQEKNCSENTTQIIKTEDRLPIENKVMEESFIKDPSIDRTPSQESVSTQPPTEVVINSADDYVVENRSDIDSPVVSSVEDDGTEGDVKDENLPMDTFIPEFTKSTFAVESSALLQEFQTESRSRKKIIWGLIAGVFLIGIFMGGGVSLWIMNQKQKNESSEIVKFDNSKEVLQNPSDDEVISPSGENGDANGDKAQENAVIEDKNKVVIFFEDDAPVAESESEGMPIKKEPVKQVSVERKEKVREPVKEVPVVSPKVKAEAAVFLSDEIAYKIVGTIDSHTIRRGDTLTKLALKYYGNKKIWPYIVKHNMKLIKNPNNVPIGTTLRIPKLVPVVQ